MQQTDLISVGAGAEWLSAQMDERWTPAMLLERLLARGVTRAWARLPPGWSLLRSDSGEPVRLPRSAMLRVADGDELLQQFAMFGDLSIAVGVAGQLVDDEDGCGYRSAAPIPVAMIRLLPDDLRALAVEAGGRPVATFLNRVAGMRADAREKSQNPPRGQAPSHE